MNTTSPTHEMHLGLPLVSEARLGAEIELAISRGEIFHRECYFRIPEDRTIRYCNDWEFRYTNDIISGLVTLEPVVKQQNQYLPSPNAHSTKYFLFHVETDPTTTFVMRPQFGNLLLSETDSRKLTEVFALAVQILKQTLDQQGAQGSACCKAVMECVKKMTTGAIEV